MEKWAIIAVEDEPSLRRAWPPAALLQWLA